MLLFFEITFYGFLTNQFKPTFGFKVVLSEVIENPFDL